MPDGDGAHKIGVSDDVRPKLVELLNSSLASTIQLFLEAKHAHWNVKGPHFYSLHLLFDEVAKHLRKQADTIAERVATLGGRAEGTAPHVVEGSELGQADWNDVSGEEFVGALADHLSRHAASVRKAIQRTDHEL